MISEPTVAQISNELKTVLQKYGRCNNMNDFNEAHEYKVKIRQNIIKQLHQEFGIEETDTFVGTSGDTKQTEAKERVRSIIGEFDYLMDLTVNKTLIRLNAPKGSTG